MFHRSVRLPAVRLVRRRQLMQAAATIGLATLIGCGTVPVGDGKRTDNNPLSEAVAVALHENPVTRPLRFEIMTIGPGRIRLLGTVNTETEKHTAEQVASAVKGVELVINTLYLN